MATKAQGTVIQIDDGTGTFVDIANVTAFSGLLGGNAAVIDTTNLSSTAKEKLIGIPDSGQVQIDMKFENDSSWNLLKTRYTSQALTNFKINIPASESGDPAVSAAFSGYVLSMPISASVDGVVEGSCTVEITGPVTFT